MIAPLSFAAGALTWSAAEYALHRFVGHGPRLSPPRGWAKLTPRGLAAAFNAEHLAHHADPMYFAPTSHKVLAAAAVLTVAGALGTIALGPRRGVSYALGLACAYAGYEVLHRRIHTHAGRTRYGRWMRRHHLLHHFKTPRANHGVTSDGWDRVGETLQRLDARAPLVVPRRHAPRWMLDTDGEISPEFREEYALAGGRRDRETEAVVG
jgi:hypothetical protein